MASHECPPCKTRMCFVVSPFLFCTRRVVARGSTGFYRLNSQVRADCNGFPGTPEVWAASNVPSHTFVHIAVSLSGRIALEDCNRPGPARRRGADLHRETRDQKSVAGQRFEIV